MFPFSRICNRSIWWNACSTYNFMVVNKDSTDSSTRRNTAIFGTLTEITAMCHGNTCRGVPSPSNKKGICVRLLLLRWRPHIFRRNHAAKMGHNVPKRKSQCNYKPGLQSWTANPNSSWLYRTRNWCSLWQEHKMGPSNKQAGYLPDNPGMLQFPVEYKVLSSLVTWITSQMNAPIHLDVSSN